MRDHVCKNEAKDNECIGRRIRDARIQRGLTQEKLAEETCLSPSYLSRIETSSKNVSLSTMIKLSRILCVSLDWLVFGYTEYENGFIPETQTLLEDCSLNEQRAILEVLKAVKNVLRVS